MPFDQPEVSNPSGSVGSTMFCKAKWAKNKLVLRGDFRQLSNKNVQIWDHLFQLLFPKDSEALKILGIRLREVGAKRRLNGTSKVNRQTNRQTDRQTDISTYRKHRPRGPMIWKAYSNQPLKLQCVTACITAIGICLQFDQSTAAKRYV